MLRKMKILVGFSFFAVLSIMLVSCSYNSLTNTTWQDTDGIRTITFNESTFRWIRKDTDRDRMGTYTISKDAIVLSFDLGYKYTGSLISGTLSFTVNTGFLDEAHVEFHRIK
ncbi:hypothetical protein AGMMS49944_17510 [Spirochaetia bacterium]|nr:hypothetical protein AGMMS49944_17510 [Spirochaetia bacterium]